MDIKLNLPFSIQGGTKKTFKILKEEELNKLSQKKGKGILNFLKKIIDKKENKENKQNKQNKQNEKEENIKKNKNSVLYTKASNTKEYYQKINRKK